MLAFNQSNLAFLSYAMVRVLLVLGVVNALAPKVADGGYSHTLFYYLGLTSMLGGGSMIIAPVLADLIFGASEIAR